MQDLVTMRYIVFILEITQEYCMANPAAVENLAQETPLLTEIVARLHDTLSAEVN